MILDGKEFNKSLCYNKENENAPWKMPKENHILYSTKHKMPSIVDEKSIKKIEIKDNTKENKKLEKETDVDLKNDIELYKRNIKELAKKKGISSRTINYFLDKVEYKETVRKLDKSQSETKSYLKDYLRNQLSDKNIEILKEKSKEKNEKLSTTFDILESIFGIEKSALMALWMHETKFGKITGGRKIIDALFTMAFDGRRREFFEKNLIQFLQIVDSGHLKIDDKGSWAGAFGNFQFMPQTFINYSIDFDGDKKSNHFSDEDSLASASNYLWHVGWKNKDGIMTHVELPNEFDYCNVGIINGKEKTIKEWKKLGIKLGKSKFGEKYFKDENKKAWLVIPDRSYMDENGCKPKAFLVYNNYAVILDWNRSMFFATTIAIYEKEIDVHLMSQ